MTENLILIAYILGVNLISLLMWRRIFFNIEMKKSPLKIFKGFFLITCNTFFTIVSYSKVQGVYLVLNLLYFLCLEWIALYDMKNKTIKNSSNILLLMLGLVSLLIRGVSCGEIFQNLIIAGGIFIIGLAIRLISKKQIGGGDIKMLVALSVRYNLTEMMKILIISIFLGAIYALYLLLIKKKDKNYRFAFGEFIALGAILLII